MTSLRPYRDDHPALGERVYVDATAVVIGRVVLGDDVSIWPGAVLRGDVNTIAVGARTSIQDGSVLHVTHDGPYSPGGRALVVGADVTIGHRVMLHGCTVGNLCLIGMGSIVLDGAEIEDRVIVGAGTLVPQGRRLRSAGLYLGAPARRARELTERELESFAYTARHYVRLKNDYLKGGR